MGSRARGRGRGRRHVEPPAVTTEELRSWFAGSMPDDWFDEPAVVSFDRDEILLTGALALPELGPDDDPAVAARARIEAFREGSRQQRMAIADRARRTYLRTVSWAVRCGDEAASFTTANVPVMTRLKMQERAVLDTLIDAGVARSRSEALAWCVRLVADNESEWIDELREALEAVVELRDRGPGSRH
ncbi:MAG: hypothetical protein ACE5GB_13735 [Acidimicrobiales bacterium]